MQKVHSEFLGQVADRCTKLEHKHGRLTSAHEGIARIREEYLELEAEVFKRPRKRDMVSVYDECVDLCGELMRFALDLGA